MIKEAAVVAVALALLWATPTQAREISDGEAAYCEAVGVTAATAMKARQAGYEASWIRTKLLAIIKKNNFRLSEKALDIIVEDAYSRPVFSTVYRQAEITIKFQLEYENFCRDVKIENEEPTT